METTVLIAVALLAIFVLYWLLQGRNDRTPPGPVGLPLVGYLPFLTSRPYLKFLELKKKYGPVFSIRMGSEYVVVLNDFETIRKAFTQDAFMGRPLESPFQLCEESIISEAFNGMPWKEQRRVCLRMLRDVGFGKTQMEEHIKEEINELLDRMAESKGQPIELSPMLAPSMSNNIASLAFGRRLKYYDPKRIQLDKLIIDSSQLAGQTAWQLFFPTLGKILTFFHLGTGRQLNEATDQLKNFFRNEIKEHEKTLDPNNIRDFIDGYLLEIQKRENDPAFNKEVLTDLVGAFFGGGSETVRVTVDWLTLTMAAYEDVKKKVQAEIDEVVGRERFPTYTDRLKMPYTEAVILEVFRWITVVPINPTRYTLTESEINGYVIPKHTKIVANIYAVHHDPELWGRDTHIFRPERFLTEDGKALKKVDQVIPFSTGKRSCPGESLARVEVFLYFAAILQKFDVRLPPGHVADFEGTFAFALQPKPQALHVLKRQ